jgi:molecular chaperone GrpE
MTDTDQSTRTPQAGAPHDGEDPAAPAAGQRADSPGASAPGESPAQGAEGACAPGENGDAAAEIEGDLDELVSVARQRDEYLALAQRTQADFENYRKRVAREAASAQERGASALAKDMLPALDNLDRALAAAQEDDPLLDGVRLVRAELAAALGRAGIESFSPLGEAFDPSLHEAVATAPQPEGGCESGIVVEVYQPGYRLGASVIRPARVVVAA